MIFCAAGGFPVGIDRTVLLNEAIRYNRDFGWTILPIRAPHFDAKGKLVKKAPTCYWTDWQKGNQSVANLRTLFQTSRQIVGLAVILGEASGDGLICRDFDKEIAYRRWASAYPSLAATLPTSRTARGYHVFHLSPTPHFDDLSDGELRGTVGQYVVLPPSLHPDGALYQWVVPPTPSPNGNLTRRTAASSGFDLCWDSATPTPHPLPIPPTRTPPTKTFKPKQDVAHEVNEERVPPSSLTSCATSDLDLTVLPRVRLAIRQTMPHPDRKRHKRVYDFVLKLKWIPEVVGQPMERLRPLVAMWHDRALPHIGKKEFAVTWSDFVDGWQRCVFDPKRSITAKAVARLGDGRSHPAAAQFKSEKVRQLVNLCWELQKLRGDKPFCLSTREAAKILKFDGIKPEVAAQRGLRTLEAAGILRRVHPGTPGVLHGGLAASFRFVG